LLSWLSLSDSWGFEFPVHSWSCSNHLISSVINSLALMRTFWGCTFIHPFCLCMGSIFYIHRTFSSKSFWTQDVCFDGSGSNGIPTPVLYPIVERSKSWSIMIECSHPLCNMPNWKDLSFTYHKSHLIL
jgi:hypothetical protein